MSQEARIRRLKDTLIIAGDAVIAFSAWSLAKMALFFVLTDEAYLRQVLEIDDNVPIFVLYIVVGVVVLIDLLVRTYIGLSARAEGKGKKKRPIYLVVAVLAAIVNVSTGISLIVGASIVFSTLDAIVSFIIEVTALTALVMVVYCSVRLRRLNRASG